MLRALLALLVLAAQEAPAQDPDLDQLLARMDAKRLALKDLRASVSVHQPIQLKTGVTDLRRWTVSSLLYRAPGNALWQVRRDRADFFHGDELDQAQGVKVAINVDDFFVHAPQALHLPHDGPGMLYNYPYGATWFHNRLSSDRPAVMPMLAREPNEFPVVLLYDLSPRKYLSMLPGLRLATKMKERGREIWILRSAPPADDGGRKEEAWRAWHYQTYVRSEVWVDVKDARIDKMVFEYESSSSSNRTRTTTEYRFARRDKIGGVEDLPTSIGIASHLDDRAPWNSRIDVTDLKVNAGVTEAEVTLQPPAARIVRDWFVQPRETYQQRPDDPAAWLALGVLFRRAFDAANAEKAFLKMIELKPEAEEGYAAYSVVAEDKKLPDAVDVLQKGVDASRSDLVRWIFARRTSDPAAARKQLETLRSSRGDLPPVMNELAERIPDPVQKRGICLASIQADLAGGGISWLWDEWKKTAPSEKEKQALVKLCEDALRKDDRTGIRLRLLELQSELGKKDEVRKQAVAILPLLEKKPSLWDFKAIDKIHEIFRGAKDSDSLKRLEKAVAAREDDDGEVLRLFVESERKVAEGDVEAWVYYLDEKMVPENGTHFDAHWEPASHFLIALKREDKLIRFMERLYLTPRSDQNYNLHRFAATHIATTKLEGSDQTKMQLRFQELDKGPAASSQEQLGLIYRLVMDKKWAEVKAKSEALLALKDLPGPMRAEACYRLAQAHQALNDLTAAVAACTKGLAEKDSLSGASLYVFKSRLQLEANDGKAAAATLAAAFEESAKQPKRARRWREVAYLLREPLTYWRDGESRRKFRDGAEALASNPAPGIQAMLGFIRESQFEHLKAADAFAKARSAWKDDPILLQWHLRATALSGQIDAAIKLREELVELLKVEKKNIADLTLASIGPANRDLSNGCLVTKNLDAARRVARLLALDPISNDNNLELASLLELVRDEAFIDEIDAALVKRALEFPSEWASFQAHYPACFAWHKMGKTAKAIAVYKEVTEENGWSKGYVQTAGAWIAQWEKEKKP